MNNLNFDNILWRSKCNTGKLLIALGFIPVILLISVPFSINFLGFSALPITLLVLFFVSIIVYCIICRKNRWLNPQLTFTMTETCVMFTTKNSNSFFYNEYENIADYSYVKHDDKFATVKLNFRHPSDAGVFGKITSMTMAKIEYFERVQEILELKGIPCKQNPTLRDKFNRTAR